MKKCSKSFKYKHSEWELASSQFAPHTERIYIYIYVLEHVGIFFEIFVAKMFRAKVFKNVADLIKNEKNEKKNKKNPGVRSSAAASHPKKNNFLACEAAKLRATQKK